MNITINDIENIVFAGIDRSDAPEFANAFIESAYNLKENRACTDEELDYIQSEYSHEVSDRLWDYLH